MRKLFSSFFLLSFITACAAPTSAPAQNFIVENTATVESAPIQFTPIPTITEAAQATAQIVSELPTSTPPTVISGSINVIKFKANGTYVDVADSIAAGSSKTYSINAMKGQIMSISVLPQTSEGEWGYVPMQIKGADGSVLCPILAGSECMFWRGVLPSSQEYYVTLMPNGNVPGFIMRVAVNPPGKAAQYFEYNNTSTGLSLTYPDTFAPSLPVVGNYKIDPELTLHFIDSKTYEKTNLGEVYVFVGSSSDASVVLTCTELNQNGGGPEQLVGNETINGFTFTHSTSEGAGAGNYYEQEVYRMVNQNKCYEVIFFIHSANIGNFTPGTVTEFNSDELMQRFFEVFNTLAIK